MARKIPKFPLLMENGAKVRNLEDLRENADVKSIVRYFQSGQLKRWCMAFGFDDLPDTFQKLTVDIIKDIYNVLDIPTDNEAIEQYAAEHGFNAGALQLSCGLSEETEVVNNEKLSAVLCNYTDKKIDLEDHAIEIISIKDKTGKLCKHKIIIANNRTEQYTSFILPYNVNSSYTKQNYLDDMYKKIAFVLQRLYDENGYCQLKNSRYASLDTGDTFELGSYNGTVLKWLVLKKENNSLFAITTDAVCQKRYDEKHNEWNSSELRNWLNGEFYDQAFSAGEAGFLGALGRDKVTLLTREEAESLMGETTRNIHSWWWLRSPSPDYSFRICRVRADGSIGYKYVYIADGGVRPVINLVF